jgi:hypothetical protein
MGLMVITLLLLRFSSKNITPQDPNYYEDEPERD